MRIGCDICNTIADVNTRIYAITGNACYDAYPLVLPKDFFNKHDDVFRAAKPLRGAAEILRHLAGEGAEIHYITARPEWARDITINWLVKHGFPAGLLHMDRPKRDVIEEHKINLMIEDHPGEVTDLQGICHVLVRAQPYNLGLPNRFNNWGQVINFKFGGATVEKTKNF